MQTFSGGRTWRYRALQAAKHKEYLFHKYDILKNLCGEGTTPKDGTPDDVRTGKVYQRWYFNTLTHSSLNFYANMFYNKRGDSWTKDVPSQQNLEKHLTPRALAYLYMDDGALKWLKHSNAMRICTESFSVEGVNRLQTALTNLYGISTTTTDKKLSSGEIGKRLAISEKESANFRQIIQPYLVNCMKYKVSDGNYGHL